MIIRPGHYRQRQPAMWATGSQYGPLQCDGCDYLCPECGGYGYLSTKGISCDFCKGLGSIALDDPRITTEKPYKILTNTSTTEPEEGQQ